MVYKPLMADVVEAPFDVALQHPLWGELAAERRKDIFTSVLCTASFAESEGLCVCCCLRYRVESQGIERLHGPVVHTGNTQRTFLSLTRFLDIFPPEGFCLVAFVCQGECAPHFRSRGFPQLFVYAGRVLTLVRSYFSDSQHFCIVRMN